MYEPMRKDEKTINNVRLLYGISGESEIEMRSKVRIGFGDTDINYILLKLTCFSLNLFEETSDIPSVNSIIAE